MVQTAQLISVLKQFLKRHGFSYRDVARLLNLSEASVKRLFSDHHFSLSRLDNVCQMMGMEISDLVVEMNQQAMASHISQLTEEQEQILVSDPVLLLVTICVLNGWTMTDLQSHYHLTRLDSLNLIVLLPLNLIWLSIANNFSWERNGPIQQFFQQKLATDFFDTGFTQRHEYLTILNGMLSDSAMQTLQRKLHQLAIEFEELNNVDRALPLAERKGTTLVLAARNWQCGLFDGIRKSSS